MLSAETTAEDQVIAYEYQMSFMSEANRSLLRAITQRIEYFIPTEKICFNEHNILTSETARNDDPHLFESHTVMKKILLPKKWVDQLKTKLGVSQICPTPESVKNVYFKQKLDIYFFAHENEFGKYYDLFGALILPNYILRYIENTNLDKNSEIGNRILQIIALLDPVEKASLEACLKERMAKREERIQQFNLYDSTLSMPIGIALGVACLITAVLTESAPTGLLLGALTFFGKTKYDQMKKNECDAYKATIFEALQQKEEYTHRPI